MKKLLNKQKTLLGLVMTALLSFFLSGCSSDSQATTQNTQTDDSSQDDTQITTTNTVSDETLSINTNRCSGCGKCARIDPEHFSISNRQAVVISQDNLTSSSLDSAISMCHDNAIELS